MNVSYQEQRATSELLLELTRHHGGPSMRVEEICAALEDRGFALLLVLFSLPMGLPLPYPPGFSSVVSAPMMLFAFQMALGWRTPWLPGFVARREVSVSSVSGVIHKTLPVLRWTERYLRPRLLILSSPLAERVIGFFCFILALCIMLPLSVLTNTIPGIGICVMALGLLHRDGLALLLGIIIGLIGLGITIAVLWLGAAGFAMLMG